VSDSSRSNRSNLILLVQPSLQSNQQVTSSKNKLIRLFGQLRSSAVPPGLSSSRPVGSSSNGEFHLEAVRQLSATGAWLKVNSERLYATRTRDGMLWSEGSNHQPLPVSILKLQANSQGRCAGSCNSAGIAIERPRAESSFHGNGLG
jgi:hypothetical protein